ncbi:DUF4082 domain-containing protein [Melittangium boletus]|uniref:DUF4082 domain-containing protein n=1 Tax=Melittangium boletus TaxID=83453 RepID=UPI003DA2684B
MRLRFLAVLLALVLPRCAPPEPAPEADPAGEATQALTPGGGLRFMTYNIKHGELSSLEAIAGVITAQAPDLVALQEVDVLTTRSGKVDQAARLGQLTGMQVAFIPSLLNFDGGQYGLALLSRYPIRSSQRIALRSASEQRVLALYTVELEAGRVLPVGVTHLGTTSATERLEQVADLKAALAGKPWALLGGDFNATPSEASISSLTQQFSDAWRRGGSGNGYTSSAGLPTRRIDYLMLGAAWTSPVVASVPGASSQSDHRPVVATVIPPWNQTLLGDRVPGTPVQADTKPVEVGVRFQSRVAGSVTALRFYRGTGNASGYVARLWTSSGTLLAQVPVRDVRLPGWQEGILSTPVRLTAGTMYVVSYSSSNGQFARDVDGFASAFVSGDLTVPVGGGVYVYAPGSFPTNSYKDTNYWVDVRFVPAP